MQIFTTKNLLDDFARNELKHLIDKEINELPDTSASKYQSYSLQNEKHIDCIPLQELCRQVKETACNLYNQEMIISNCWFVICKEDSVFGFHNHIPEKLSAVYYLENCNSNGTIFEHYYTKLQVLNEDNTAIFFDPSIMHSTPAWNGKDRYCITFDFDLAEATPCGM